MAAHVLPQIATIHIFLWGSMLCKQWVGLRAARNRCLSHCSIKSADHVCGQFYIEACLWTVLLGDLFVDSFTMRRVFEQFYIETCLWTREAGEERLWIEQLQRFDGPRWSVIE